MRSTKPKTAAKLIVEQTKKDQFYGPEDLARLARVYAMLGRADEAVDILEDLQDTVYSNPIPPTA